MDKQQLEAIIDDALDDFGHYIVNEPETSRTTLKLTPKLKIMAAVEAYGMAERIDERENMKFIDADGQETFAPYLQYRYTGDGLLLDWEDRTKQLDERLQAKQPERGDLGGTHTV